MAQETLRYLQLLSASTNIPDDELMSRLFLSLEADGYQCQIESRQLSEQPLTPSDSEFVTYVILVMLCILCAAAANGLTQVSPPRSSRDSLTVTGLALS
jgi:hypothetical protein